jgi:hypothetical protein
MLWNNNYNYIESIDQRISRGAPNLLPIEYLIVGGGAAGLINDGTIGSGSYAGGGAGGFLTGSLNLFQNTSYNIFIGSGGVVASSPASESYFRGLNYTTFIDLHASGAVLSTSGVPQSFIAGIGDIAAGAYYFGGGGGSGMRNGYNGVNPNTGNGGDAFFWYSGSYCGGGGGGTVNPVSAPGGLGGNTTVVPNKGGAGDGGSTINPSTAGVANTGGGGGAAGNNNGSPASNGGSGIVVVRYLTQPEIPGFPLATGGIKYTEGSYTYHRFISGSSEFRTFTL